MTSIMEKFFITQTCQYQKKLFANDRIVPYITNDGSIKGTLLMINNFYTETEVLKINYFDIDTKFKAKKIYQFKYGSMLRKLEEKNG